jgi:hypothetical protein
MIRSNEGELKVNWQKAHNTIFHSDADVKVELTTESVGSSLRQE